MSRNILLGLLLALAAALYTDRVELNKSRRSVTVCYAAMNEVVRQRDRYDTERTDLIEQLYWIGVKHEGRR